MPSRETPPEKRQAAGLTRSVTMTTLGLNGRFGNQLLQYGFLRLLGARHGLRVELPDWIGRDLFDLADPFPSHQLPVVREVLDRHPQLLLDGAALDLADCDFWGYCCYPTRYFRPKQQLFRTLFRPGHRVAALAQGIRDRLGAMGETVVALHLRRGDFGTGRFWIAPEAWYLAWLHRIWPALPRPVLYLATDDPRTKEAFEHFSPVLASDLAEPPAGAEFLVDFFALCRADRLAISNSTFSFVASMLNESAAECMRPDPKLRALVPYDPWDAEILIDR
jgi:hypothetical protein